MLYYPVLSGHTGDIRLFDKLRHEFYWPYKENHAYNAVANYQSCTAQRSRSSHHKELWLFPTAGTLEFVAMDILHPLFKTESGSQHEIFLTDWYTKLTRSIHVIAVASANAAYVFVDKWVIVYDIPAYLLTETESQFVFMLLAAVTVRLGVKH